MYQKYVKGQIQIQLKVMDIINQKELIEKGIKQNIVSNMKSPIPDLLPLNRFQPFNNEKNSEHFSSFLYRLTHNYQDYISKFKKLEDCVHTTSIINNFVNEIKTRKKHHLIKQFKHDNFYHKNSFTDFSEICTDDILIYTGESDLKLGNKEDELLELEIFSNFYRDYSAQVPNETPFALNPNNFLYNFFCYLFYNRTDLDKIIRLEFSNDRFFKFKNGLFFIFGKFDKELNEQISKEMTEFQGNSPSKTKIVREIIRRTFS